MLASNDAPAQVTSEPTVEHRVIAPHVATLVATATIGDQVDTGQTIATIAVLDAEEALSSPVTGRIARLEAAVGDLVEYGQTLVVIEAAA